MIGDRWGVGSAEVAERYACDQHLGGRPTLTAWRGVTVEAPAEVVWSWLVQLRIAPYSYDWLDNRGHRSPRTLLHLADPCVGEHFSASGGRPVGRVLAVDPGRELTAAVMGVVMTYRLTPVGPDRTRLVLKLVGAIPRPLAGLATIGDLVMARRQLLNLKKHAETTASTVG